MFRGLGNIANLMKQAQEMGGKLEEINAQLRAKRVSGAAGGGMVEVEANGLGEILRVTVDPQLVERQERDMIEDLIPAAVNQAITRARETHAEMMKSMTEGLQLPGLDEAIAKFANLGTTQDESL